MRKVVHGVAGHPAASLEGETTSRVLPRTKLSFATLLHRVPAHFVTFSFLVRQLFRESA